MKKNFGFTLIELVVFVVVIGILASGVLLAYNKVFAKSPRANYQLVATESATKCLEWFIGQRSINGYASIVCPSTTVPNFCAVPNGYNISVDVSYVSLYGEAAANYKKITTTVTGLGTATISMILAKY